MEEGRPGLANLCMICTPPCNHVQLSASLPIGGAPSQHVQLHVVHVV